MPKLLDILLDDQRQRWWRGDGALVEQYLAEYPALLDDEEGIVDLVYQEFVLRAQLGGGADPKEYFDRFPQHRTALEAQFAFLSAVQRTGDKPTMVRAPAWPTRHGAVGLVGGTPRLEPGSAVATEWPRLNGYEIQAEVGFGAAGMVYKAWHFALRRHVAVKFIHVEKGMEPEARARFRGEAEAVARLQHPNVVQIYEVGEEEGRLYLVMEFVDGGTLAQRVAKGPLPAREAAELMSMVARAVHHAHGRGVIHRDLKPANILVQDQEEPRATAGELAAAPANGWSPSLQPKITDFGLAKQLKQERDQLTKSGAVLGTPSYMAPEQASGQGRNADPSTDIYALGAILYETITGRPPFLADTPLATLQQVIDCEPLAPTSLQPALPRDLSTICLKCLEKDPRRRYASAAALADDLGRFQRGESIKARLAGPLERGWRWCRHRPLAASLAATAASLLVLVLVSGAISVIEWRQSVELGQQERRARLRAENNLAIARRLVSQLAAVSDVPLPQEQDAHRRHQSDVLRQAESFCLELLKEPQAGTEIRLTLAEVYDRWCRLYLSSGDFPAAQQAVEKAVAQWQVLADANPGTTRYDLGAARADCQLAGIHRQHGDFAKALVLFRRGHDRIRPHAAQGDVSVSLDLVAFKVNIATCFMRLASHAEALTMSREARDHALSLMHDCRDAAVHLALQEQLAGMYEEIAMLLAHHGESAEAQKSWTHARALYRQMLAETLRAAPKLVLPRDRVRAHKEHLADCCVRAAQYAGGTDGDYREAITLLEEICREQGSLNHEDPAAVSRKLGQDQNRIAQCYHALGEFPAAVEACYAAVHHCEEAMRRNPGDASPAQVWLKSLGRLAELQESAGRHAEATATLRRLTEGMDLQVSAAGTDRGRRAAIASSFDGLSAELRAIPANVQALEAAKRARQIFEELTAQVPTEYAYQVGLSDAWAQIASCYWRFGDYEQILHACHEAVAISRRMYELDPQSVEYRGMLNARRIKLERILGHLKRRQEVLASILEREKLWGGNSEGLQAVARDLRKLSDSVGDGKTELTTNERAERQSYLEHFARVEQAALALDSAKRR